MKSISGWFNHSGVDECFGELEGKEFNEEGLEELKEVWDLLEGVSIGEFEVEMEGKGWKMWGFDGMGIFENDGTKSMEDAKKEYDKGWD